jgi:hypothetical protein
MELSITIWRAIGNKFHTFEVVLQVDMMLYDMICLSTVIPGIFQVLTAAGVKMTALWDETTRYCP